MDIFLNKNPGLSHITTNNDVITDFNKLNESLP